MAAAFVQDWLDVFRIASADDATLVEAMAAVDEHLLSFWDAMLWARQAGCSAIVSEDMRDGHRFGGVEVVNPFASDVAARLAPLLDG